MLHDTVPNAPKLLFPTACNAHNGILTQYFYLQKVPNESLKIMNVVAFALIFEIISRIRESFGFFDDRSVWIFPWNIPKISEKFCTFLPTISYRKAISDYSEMSWSYSGLFENVSYDCKAFSAIKAVVILNGALTVTLVQSMAGRFFHAIVDICGHFFKSGWKTWILFTRK